MSPAPAKPAAPATKPRTFTTIKASKPTPRIVMYGVEGFGKTTFAAHAEGVAIIMPRGETGVKRLVDSARIPEIPTIPVENWQEGLDWLDDLIQDQRGLKALAIDTIGSLERLCHEHVCKRDFQGEWGDRGFGSFQKGFDVSVSEWLKLLQRLDTLNKKGLTIMLLGHAKIKTFKNPVGADFDRYVCDVHDKTWAVTARWADCVYFGNFVTVVDATDKQKKKGKGIGGTERVIYTQRRDAWDAKPGYAVPEFIDIPNDHTQVYSTIFNAIEGKE